MPLKSRIGAYLGMEKLGEEVVGIEIEIESLTPFPPSEETKYSWKKEHDGSLRGEHNIEYVLRYPMIRKKAIKALDRLSLKLNKEGTEIIDSVRAGTHIHINIRDLSFLEMWSMVTCWYILEELLTSTICGKDRVGNHFCLCAQDADAVLFKIRQTLKGANFRELGRDNIRYSALNIAAILKYGSLEFRGMRTPQDFEIIKWWIDILLNIKENSKLFPNPRHVVENFSLGGGRNFLRQILGNENAERIINLDPHKWKERLQRGVRIAQEIAYARDNWDKEEEKIEHQEHHIIEFARRFNVEIDDNVQ